MTNHKNLKRYRTFRSYLKEKYPYSVRKITLHGNLTCPNRDGTLGTTGCLYCNNQAFHPLELSQISIQDQMSLQIERYLRKDRHQKFIAYFQTFSNTYASLERLKTMYDTVREFSDIVGIAIGTRPDCVNEEILNLIETYTDTYEVWIEYGLQSSHNKTLEKINRGHTCQQFLEAVELTSSRPIRICVHVILGLPGENHEDVLQTARLISQLPIHGIKFHPLQIIRNTPMESMYRNGEIQLLDGETYARWVVDFLEILPPGMVVQRITADAPDIWLIAPDWCRNKMNVINRVDHIFNSRNSRQGKKYIIKNGHHAENI